MIVKDKLVLVTGASSGIGAAAAKAMAKAGGRVVLLARGKDLLDRVAAEITSVGGIARIYPVDLADAEAVAAVAKQISEELGTPDIIVNNAGAGRWLFVDETTPVQAVQMMAVPYFAAFNVTHAFLPAILKRNSGHFVFISSVGSRFVWPGATAYIAARWAVRGFSEALRADLDGTGIGVTLYESGVVTSHYWEHNPGSRERVPKMGKLVPEVTPEQAANAIVDGVERNKRHVVIPFMMRLTLWNHALFPWAVQWLMTKTGYRRI
ncbi:MAG: SDR family NAD(P)-dependent oxidoreductase [Geobacteraceae bacterium]|jgi:short-subunit dehydrogenase